MNVLVHTDGVDLVHEDDAGLVVAGVVEHLSDESGALPNVLIHDGAGHHLETNHTHSSVSDSRLLKENQTPEKKIGSRVSSLRLLLIKLPFHSASISGGQVCHIKH